MRSAQGPLQELPGRWVGRGFNLIARPDFAARSVPPGPGDKSALFLELNFTNETLKFDSIGSPIPNRGFDQNDIELHGVHYLQQIADLNTGGALHLEPGIWITIRRRPSRSKRRASPGWRRSRTGPSCWPRGPGSRSRAAPGSSPPTQFPSR